MQLLDFCIISVFFALVAFGPVALSPAAYAGLFAALAVGRVLKGKSL